MIYNREVLRLLSTSSLKKYLNSSGALQRELLAEADRVRKKAVGANVYFRGIVEFSNICEKNCYYCGIRKGNKAVRRYRMSFEEINECLKFIERVRYGSVVLQSGETTFHAAQDFLLQIVRHIHKRYPAMGVTLSCGELSFDQMKELKEAGAHRYLLRIETSVPRLYRLLHPRDHSIARRKQCLKDLRVLGYQVGSGIMIGLPGQTDDDLIADLRYFQKNDFDMFGLGPYVIHDQTPLVTPNVRAWWNDRREEIFQKTLNFIAILRILMPTCNIAAATALEVFHRTGRVEALKAGANVIMPVVTPRAYRHDYLLYQGKPCIDEDATKCSGCIVGKVRAAGLVPALGIQGNSLHFIQRTKG